MTTYDINFKRKKRVPMKQRSVVFSLVSLYVLACLLTVASVGFFMLASSSMIDVYGSEIARLKSGLAEQYKASPTESILRGAMKNIEPDIQEIGKLLDDRTAFTPILEALAQTIPEGVWLVHVKVTDPPREGGGRSRNRTKGRKQGSFNALVLEGLALVSEDDPASGDEAIRVFADNIEKDATIRDTLKEVKFTETEIKEIRGTKVIGFEIICTFVD